MPTTVYYAAEVDATSVEFTDSSGHIVTVVAGETFANVRMDSTGFPGECYVIVTPTLGQYAGKKIRVNFDCTAIKPYEA